MSAINDLYQELIRDHSRRPRNHRPLPEADHSAEGHNPLCGDHVTIHLKLADGIVREATFEGTGCAISTASASLMTEAIKGQTLEQAKALFRKFHNLVTGEARETSDSPNLGKLEVFSGVCQYPMRVKCATLAWHTMEVALENEAQPVTTE
ncbi:MAG: SUF system NifU family Fe-S cluster assembly protein [Phycisphaerales bacterium]|mgnify:CR=1 FL=1|nr:SUF system NifU family Fe-S cluster assembly protein [Phycisphaerales bacterium]